MKWISSTGGPLIVIPELSAPLWSGVHKKGAGQSDYDRACNINGYVGVLSNPSCEVLVLNDEPLDTCVFSLQGRTVLVRWVHAPSEARVLEELARFTFSACRVVESVLIEMGHARNYIFDSSTPGSQLREYECITLTPGAQIV